MLTFGRGLSWDMARLYRREGDQIVVYPQITPPMIAGGLLLGALLLVCVIVGIVIFI